MNFLSLQIHRLIILSSLSTLLSLCLCIVFAFFIFRDGQLESDCRPSPAILSSACRQSVRRWNNFLYLFPNLHIPSSMSFAPPTLTNFLFLLPSSHSFPCPSRSLLSSCSHPSPPSNFPLSYFCPHYPHLVAFSSFSFCSSSIPLPPAHLTYCSSFSRSSSPSFLPSLFLSTPRFFLFIPFPLPPYPYSSLALHFLFFIISINLPYLIYFLSIYLFSLLPIFLIILLILLL